MRYLFTDVPEIDLAILKLLDRPTLYLVSLLNKYAHSLCHDNSIWQAQAERRFPDLIKGKEPGESWREFYRFVQTKFRSNLLQVLITHKRFKFLEHFKDQINVYNLSMAVESSSLDTLKWIHRKIGILPDQDGANGAVKAGRLDILDWLLSLGVTPDQDGVAYAALTERIEILDWMFAHNLLLPGQWEANRVAENGCLKALKWMKHRGLPLPNQTGADLAARSGQEEVLKWINHELGLSPSKFGIEMAVQRGHLNVLKWAKDNREG